MQVKCTKTMADYIRKNTTHKNYDIELLKMNEREYAVRVDYETYRHDIDYNISTERFNVIAVIYPDEYYACNHYLTTTDLNKIFKESDKTATGFMNVLDDYIAI